MYNVAEWNDLDKTETGGLLDARQKSNPESRWAAACNINICFLHCRKQKLRTRSFTQREEV